MFQVVVWEDQTIFLRNLYENMEEHIGWDFTQSIIISYSTVMHSIEEFFDIERVNDGK